MKLTDRNAGRFDVYDGVLMDPLVYRAAALRRSFSSVRAGSDVFHGIAPCDDSFVGRLVETLLPPGARTSLTFFRKSPHGQDEPNYVHTDAMMGDWTAVLYLNPESPPGDGTSFWRQASGADSGQTVDGLSRDLSDWERWQHIDAKFNRLLVFRSDLYHSRGLADNFGSGDEARLIQIVFGHGALHA